MKIHIDEELCSGHGRCYSLSPDLVQANDEGYSGAARASRCRPRRRGEPAGPWPCPEGAMVAAPGRLGELPPLAR